MHRFFVPRDWIDGDRARLEGDVAHRATRVLRLSTGDQVTLLDDSGAEYTVALSSISPDLVHGHVLSMERGVWGAGRPGGVVSGDDEGREVRLGAPEGDGAGVSTFVPSSARRSIPRPKSGGSGARHTRWEKIVSEAAEQSGRSLLPQVHHPVAFDQACDSISESRATSIIPWEREGALGLRSALSQLHLEDQSPSINIFIGPEGGFEKVEVDYARSCGVLPVSLGPRILRSETAAIAVVAAVLYELGELGG